MITRHAPPTSRLSASVLSRPLLTFAVSETIPDDRRVHSNPRASNARGLSRRFGVVTAPRPANPDDATRSVGRAR